MALSTHCKQGHPYDEVTTCTGRDGYKYCFVCYFLRHGKELPEKYKKYVHGNEKYFKRATTRMRPQFCEKGHPLLEVNARVTSITAVKGCELCRYLRKNYHVPDALKRYVRGDEVYD